MSAATQERSWGGELEELDALLALAGCGALPVAACLRMATLVEHAPGRLTRVAACLSRQRDAASVEALLVLPSGTRGVVEGVFGALRRGVTRELEVPELGTSRAPRMVALEFRSSKSKRFPALITRAQAAFGPRLERLRVEGGLHYRVALFEGVEGVEGVELRAQVRALALDLERIHRDLSRLRGVRLWLNGWCFDEGSSLPPAARVPLLRGWLDWSLEGSLEERCGS